MTQIVKDKVAVLYALNEKGPTTEFVINEYWERMLSYIFKP